MQRQPIKEKNRTIGYETVETDPGIVDKRALCIEAEFASVLRAIERKGSTLSALLRLAWETGDLQRLTKNSPLKATGAHISVIGHVTVEEIRRNLAETEMANGFGNRFLWVCTKRARELPEGGCLTLGQLEAFVPEVQHAVQDAKSVGEVSFDERARHLWHEVYSGLSKGRPGLAGALVGRAEAQVRRLALVYTLMDGERRTGVCHLKAALAVWRYCADSVRYIFGDSLGDRVADELLRLLKNSPSGLSRTEMSDFLGRNESSDRIARALGLLLQLGKARREEQKTAGRPAERWFAVA
jgi:hypothetical protein